MSSVEKGEVSVAVHSSKKMDEGLSWREEAAGRLQSRARRKSRGVWGGLSLRSGDACCLITRINDEETGGPKMTFFGTRVSLDAADAGEFVKVHLSAFADTLPLAYRVDLFEDYILPFFRRNTLSRFGEGDVLTIEAVQFKILATDPCSLSVRSGISAHGLQISRPLSLLASHVLGLAFPSSAPSEQDMSRRQRRRVGVSTQVFLGRPIFPHWVDVLPAAQQRELFALPPQLQAFSLVRLIGETPAIDFDRVFSVMNAQLTRAEVSAEREAAIRGICEAGAAEMDATTETVYCVVCLSELTGQVVRLKCLHAFHNNCLLNWFRRSLTCPLCKVEA